MSGSVNATPQAVRAMEFYIGQVWEVTRTLLDAYSVDTGNVTKVTPWKALPGPARQAFAVSAHNSLAAIFGLVVDISAAAEEE